MIKYNPEISAGSIGTVISVLLSVGTAYLGLSNTDIKHDQLIAAQSEKIQRVEKDTLDNRNDVKEQLKELQRSVKNLDDKFTNYVIENASKPKR